MMSNLKISNLTSLLLFTLFAYIPAHAEDTPSYHLLTALDDGYYGYSARTPEKFTFVIVKDGEPIVFYSQTKEDTRTTCKPSYYDDEILFKMSSERLLSLFMGSIHGRQVSLYKNTDTRGSLAAISEVRTDQHLACSGKIVRE